MRARHLIVAGAALLGLGWLACRQAKAVECRVQLSGALEGSYGCDARFEREGEGLAVRLDTPPGAPAEVSLRAVLAPRGSKLVLVEGAPVHASVRQRSRDGGFWGEPEAIEAVSVVEPAQGRVRVKLRVRRPETPGDPRPVDVDADVVLSRPEGSELSRWL